MVSKAQTLNEEKLIAFLASLCLFLSAIEYVIPKPLPFMRLGLANMPILLSLYVLKPRQYFFLVLLKVLGQGFVSGTFFSYIFVFSVSGSFLASLAMFISHRIAKKHIGPIGIGLLGALANAASQIILSDIMLFGDSIQYIAPALIISSCVTGLLLGIFTARFLQVSTWYSSLNIVRCDNEK